MKKKPIALLSAIGLLSAVAVASLAGNVLLYKEVRSLRANPPQAQVQAQSQADTQAQVQEENAKLVERVGRLMTLPDEQPTIATVTDPTKLPNEPFFLQAKTGDKVLIYTAAKKAVLYDPVADKILEVAPLTMDAGTQTGDDATAAPTTAKKKPAGTTAINSPYGAP